MKDYSIKKKIEKVYIYVFEYTYIWGFSGADKFVGYTIKYFVGL